MNTKDTLTEVLKSILPITIVIIILQILLNGFILENFISFILGAVLTTIGFVLFLIGVNNSLLPLGEYIGKTIITNSKLWFILLFGFTVGFAATIAEPGVQILANQFSEISNDFLNKYVMIIFIAFGVGIFLGLSLLRFIFGISLRKILLISYTLVFMLAIFSPLEFLAVSFDSSGVTTGPMAVPFILSLGIGVTSVKGTKKETHESFGFIGLASVGPILAVLILGVIFG